MRIDPKLLLKAVALSALRAKDNVRYNTQVLSEDPIVGELIEHARGEQNRFVASGSMYHAGFLAGYEYRKLEEAGNKTKKATGN